MNNGCQGVERENQDFLIGGGCDGYDEDAAIGSWRVLGREFSSYAEDQENILFSSIDELYR